jgi:TATA-box binding protein (TBP) (component of TFIID and TFIIIB)
MTDLINGLYKSKLELLNLPYDLVISTTTITCHLDITFNVENIGLYFNDFDDVIIGKRYGNRIVNNLINVKKLKIGKKKKRREKKNFYNQVSLIFRSATLMGLDPEILDIKEKFKTVNIKLFINGSIQMTGCKHLNNIKKSLEILFDKLKTCKAILNRELKFDIKPFVDDITKLDINKVTNFKIVMINTNFNIQFQINREKLHYLLKELGFDVTFDPIIHACVNIKYHIPNTFNKTISIFVFESGSITIAGSNSCQQVLDTYNFINKFILSNYSKLLTKNITPQLIVELIKNMY